MANKLSTSEKIAAQKEAFVSEAIAGAKAMASRFNKSYVMDAVRKGHMQNLRAAVDDPMSMHGMVFKTLEENGAVGAQTIRKGINKARVTLGDIDTGLGAMAVGKDGVTNDANKSLRKTLFTYAKDNYKIVKNKDGHTLVSQSRPSITAPLHTVSNLVVPSLAMMKGQEIVQGFRNKGKEQGDYAGYYPQGGQS